MAVIDHDHSLPRTDAWTGTRNAGGWNKERGSVVGFLVLWLLFFALVGAVNYIVEWLF